jgi:hypothetical protein
MHESRSSSRRDFIRRGATVAWGAPMILTMMSGGAYAQSCAPDGTPCAENRPATPGGPPFCNPIFVGGAIVTCCNGCWPTGNTTPGEVCMVCNASP